MTVKHLLSALVVAGSLLQGTAALAQSPSTPGAIPVRDFFRKPAVMSPQLSPNGKKLAMLVPAGKDRVGLAVADVATPDKFVGIAQFEDADITRFSWVNDGRLVFQAFDWQAPAAYQQGSGLYAVNADGTEFKWLIERNGNYRTVGVPSERPLPNRYRFLTTVDDGSDDVIAVRWNFIRAGDPSDGTLVRLNTRTMVPRTIAGDVPAGANAWWLDRQNRLRAVATGGNYNDTSITIHWLPENGGAWQQLAKFDAIDPPPGSFQPVAVDHDGNLLVAAWVQEGGRNPERYATLHRYDTARRAVDPKPIVSLKGYDFDGAVLFDDAARKVSGIFYTSDATGVAWLDPELKALQEAVDKQLTGTNNVFVCRRCSQAKHFIVTAYSDRQPAAYFLLDRETRKLRLIGATYPWLDSRLLAEQDVVRIKARDGLEIPTYITKPKGKGPWPTVVMVHGGPFVRGHQWGFSPDAQFLASRGYLVIEPEFRGSTGYGDRHFKAGWKQWGLGMQDDVTDVTRWAIQQGHADPRRVAIAGASYGGYATMMGLVKEPDLYKAGINWVGVTDIELMYDIGWSDFSGSQWMRFGMPRMVGDPKKDAEQLKATSPLQQAHRIKQPVLMAYGEEDLRVPLPHGTKMRDALVRAGNKQVEWVQYKDEGHGFVLLENNVDFWSRVERFLAQHLK